ncbi:hypothetical protein AWRI1631_100180 [Saccharomyces cerevisiae AWRI1631]|uniref:S.cerevisiae PRP21, SPP91, CDC6, NUC1, CRY2 and S24 genes n=2 Tax=Saccharomyces cerevisiae TaxID=4932 RepID=A2NXN3_YEASX|nr:hypothetical protein AWRI1631_100180 [Saccharomyces cerevisiae AWRI1631]CAA54763.1 unnamed protein product [Saccharomyces cerevisiae]
MVLSLALDLSNLAFSNSLLGKVAGFSQLYILSSENASFEPNSLHSQTIISFIERIANGVEVKLSLILSNASGLSVNSGSVLASSSTSSVSSISSSRSLVLFTFSLFVTVSLFSSSSPDWKGLEKFFASLPSVSPSSSTCIRTPSAQSTKDE